MSSHSNKVVRKNIYSRWAGMKKRCEDSSDNAYKDYGGRGINVCELWQDFNEFYRWSLASGYSKELQIDRIDNEKGYSPENCRWVTAQENSFNRRNSVLVEVDGSLFRLSNLSKKTGISYEALLSRYRRGDRGDYLVRPMRDDLGKYESEEITKPKKESLRQWLKDIRVDANLTQQEVSDLAGMSRVNYSHIENGFRKVTTENAMKIAEVLGFNWTMFLKDKESVRY